MKYKAEVREIPEHIVYYKEYNVHSHYDFFENGNILQELSDQVMRENPDIDLTEPDYNYLVYVDGEVKSEDMRLAFCDAVTAFGKDGEDYEFRLMERITAVTVLHKGPYEKLNEAYAFAYKWIKENGYEVTGCPRDGTIDGCWNRTSREDYLMEIQIPVKK